MAQIYIEKKLLWGFIFTVGVVLTLFLGELTAVMELAWDYTLCAKQLKN